MNPDPQIIVALIPVVGTLAALGMPVAIVFIVKHFRLRDRELEAEIEARRFWNEKERARLEARIERVEAMLFQRAGAPLPASSLMDAPAAEPASLPPATRADPLRQK